MCSVGTRTEVGARREQLLCRSSPLAWGKRMKAKRLLVRLALLVICGSTGCGPRTGDVYLFDCLGTVTRLDGSDLSLTPGRHVSQIDTTLPAQVRDGCSIRGGWYEADADRLLLVVQTEPVQGTNDDSLPTKVLAVAVPDLRSGTGSSLRMDGVQSEQRQEMRTRILSIDPPFVFNAAYPLYGESKALFQELIEPDVGNQPILAHVLWEPGVPTMRRSSRAATGRYALIDLERNERDGSVVSTAGNTADDRVVCFTPDGLVVIANTRDSLLVLDTRDGERRQAHTDTGLDLYWTGCAWN